MDEDPSYLGTLSLHLSRVLDEVGLNSLTVRRRRRLHLFMEQLIQMRFPLTPGDKYCYYFGSQTEGTTIPELGSDLDMLVCNLDYNVIQDWPDWQQGKYNLLMLQERTAPGNCRLQALMNDVAMAEEELLGNYYTYDSNGRVLLKNTWLNTPEPGSGRVRNGPARSSLGRDGYVDMDFVSALHCKSWPTQAEEFYKRQRRYGWPSQNLLQEVVKHGVLLVPVGYKLSPTEHLEWRISASLAERYLMFSLDTVHIKCYVLLKILIKTFIEPRAKKSISSYYCKTAIFYSVENTVPEFWRDDNLLRCVTHCLTLLLTWVTDGFCPQFVIAEANMFAGKVTAQNRNTLQSVLKDLIMGNGRALLYVHIADIGRKLQAKLCTEPSAVPILNSRTTFILIAELEYTKQGIINLRMKDSVKDKNTELVPLIRSVHRNILIWKGRIRHSEKHTRQAIEIYMEFLSRWLGSLLASLSLSNEMRVPRTAIQLLRTGVKYDVASMLKLASVFYNGGDFRKVHTILCGIENHASNNTMQSLCNCYDKPKFLSPQMFIHNLYFLRGSRARSQLFAHCVSFSPHEIHCAPPELRSEFFRSVGDDLQHRDPKEDDWMDMAAVDCLPFIYYLQYMTYRQLGKLYLQKQSLHNLGLCLRNDHAFGHLETGWNLLGQCKELEQDSEAAMHCYRTSLEIRPRNNAANWHVAILCYKVLKTRIYWHVQNTFYMLIWSGCLPI